MKISLNRLIMAAATLASLESAPRAQGDDSAEQIRVLQRRIDELEQKVKALDRNHRLAREPAPEKPKAAPQVSIGTDGFKVQSADTNFVLRVGAHIQADARFYPDTPNNAGTHSTFLMRKIRPIIEGTVYEKFDYRLMLDFGTGIGSVNGNNGFVQEAYVNARFLPELQLQGGKFKGPVGLERLQADIDVPFVERAFPTGLVPNRDVGVQLQGQLWHGVFHYAVGVFNGVPDGGSGDIEVADDDKEVAARLFAHPFKQTHVEPLRGLGMGLAGTFGRQEGALSSYVTPGQQKFFSYFIGTGTAAAPNVSAAGDHWRLTPQGYYYWGAFGLLGEYVVSAQQVSRVAGGPPSYAWVDNRAWQVTASCFLTGEENAFRSVTPRHPFSLSGGGWGAWEILARVSQLNVDAAAFPRLANPAAMPSAATDWGVGLIWYLNKNFKFYLDYDQTDFKGGQANPLVAKGEKAVMGRFQLAF